MEEQFVPYELTVKLKELGFNEERLARYWVVTEWEKLTGEIRLQLFLDASIEDKFLIKTPLWQQAFDWFREKYNLDSYVRKITYRNWKLEINYILQNDSKEEWEKYKKFQDYKDTQKEARRACLEKLIELCKKK